MPPFSIFLPLTPHLLSSPPFLSIISHSPFFYPTSPLLPDPFFVPLFHHVYHPHSTSNCIISLRLPLFLFNVYLPYHHPPSYKHLSKLCTSLSFALVYKLCTCSSSTAVNISGPVWKPHIIITNLKYNLNWAHCEILQLYTWP